MPNRPLTDAAIARKFGIEMSDPHFETARKMSLSRPDRTICDFPELVCPHFMASFIYSEDYDGSDWAAGDLIVCNECERTIFVERADPKTLLLTLTTEPNNPCV